MPDNDTPLCTQKMRTAPPSVPRSYVQKPDPVRLRQWCEPNFLMWIMHGGKIQGGGQTESFHQA